MLRLHGAGLFRESILTFKGEDFLSRHALRLIPCSISGVVMIVELDYVFKVGSVCFVGQTILLSHGLGAIDQWEAVGVRRVVISWQTSYQWVIPLTFQLLAPTNAPKNCIWVIISGDHIILILLWILTVNLNAVAHFLLRFSAPGAFCTSSLTLTTVVLHHPEQQQFYLPLMLVCPFSVLLFGILTSGFAR